MHKVWFLLIVGALLVVTVSCGGGQSTPTSNVPTTEPATTTEEGPSPPASPPGQASCRAVPPVGVPIDNLPSVTDQDWTLGPADAPVTLIEYADFQ